MANDIMMNASDADENYSRRGYGTCFPLYESDAAN